jgi:chloramphenicol-sensitive protein RarD
MNETLSIRRAGLGFAIGAYLAWGLLPLYLRLVSAIPAWEFVGWRVLFTLPVCLVLVAGTRRFTQVRAALVSPRLLAALAVSALLIGANWLIYIAAIQSGHVLASSLGYYINPLVNVALGTLFLGERLRRAQWLAVAIAGLGVGVLAWGAADTLVVSLSLALTFGGYGLVRKLTPVESLPGLTVETLLLALPAVAMIAWQGHASGGVALGRDPGLDALAAVSGVITATPLLLFAAAARRLDFSTLGFCQYLAPTMVFVLGLTVFGEPLRPVQLVSFVLIWAAVLVFSWDVWRQRSA